MVLGQSPRAKRAYKARGIPAYASVGRQPELLYQHSPWYGSIVAGDDLTAEQRRAMAARGLSDAQRITVRRLASQREYWWPTTPGGRSERPYFEFRCPIDRHRKDGRIFVVAPGGEVKLVHADGWVF